MLSFSKKYFPIDSVKAELLQEGIIFLINLFARAVLLMKKLKIEVAKATKYSTFKTDVIKVGLVFSISNLFTGMNIVL